MQLVLQDLIGYIINYSSFHITCTKFKYHHLYVDVLQPYDIYACDTTSTHHYFECMNVFMHEGRLAIYYTLAHRWNSHNKRI